VLTLAEFLVLACQCCKGMAYLETLGFAHCDLAARNVLVADDNVCKIADFGMTRRLRHRPNWRGPAMMKVAIRWSAVEVLEGRVFSLKSDVWAFGILVWEIFAYGAMPYGNLKNAEVHRTLMAGGRIQMMKSMPKNVQSLLRTTWEANPQERPSFKSLSSELETYLRSAPSKKTPRDIGRTIKEAKAADSKAKGKHKTKQVVRQDDTYTYTTQGGWK